MPNYDYQCSTCGVCFEVFQSFSEDALKKCPTKKSGDSPQGCTSVGRGRVTKVFSAPGISFKGSGFYKNDSRSGGSSTNGSKSESGSKSSSEKDSSTTSSGSSKDSSSSKSSSESSSKSSSSTSSSSSSD